MMHIVFRLDSSNTIGAGHAMRCLALANALKTNYQVSITFICCPLPGNCIQEIKKQFTVLEITTPDNEIPEINKFLKALKDPDWLIVDHYGLDCSWEKSTRPYVKNIAVIDDLANRTHDCDILIDQNYSDQTSCRYQNKVIKTCQVFTGPKYALLRSEFREARLSLHYPEKEVKQLLISLGGNDADNVTMFVLKALDAPLFLPMTIVVVAGGGNPHRNEIKTFCEMKHYQYYCQANNMANLMAQSNLCIGAGGISTWERCCVGLPALMISLAFNQDVLIKNALSAQVFEYAGQADKLDRHQFQRTLMDLIFNHEKRLEMRKSGLALVDGLGAERVAALLVGIKND